MNLEVFSKLCQALGVKFPKSFVVSGSFSSQNPHYREVMSATEHYNLHKSIDNNYPTSNFFGEEYTAIPVYDIYSSVGFSEKDEDELDYPVSRELKRTGWLSQFTRDVSSLAFVIAAGDAMEPTIRGGDMMLVDRSVRRIDREGIYIIRAGNGDELLVRRCVRSLKGGSLSVSADNPSYMTESEVSDADLDVLGRAVWLGKRL